jgi:hypothetical protein
MKGRHCRDRMVVGFTTTYAASAYRHWFCELESRSGRARGVQHYVINRDGSRISSLGGGHLKKMRRAEGGARIFGVFRVKNHDFTPKNHIFSNCGGRHENVWGISCEKSRFYAKKSYFFQLRREARNILGYFVWKITILRQKIIFFPILGDKVYPGTPASSTTKTGRHDIAEILLKVAY